jgi:hypothetical protein
LIKISIDHLSQRYYNLVEVDNTIIDYENNSIVISSELSETIVCQEVVELS